MRLWSLHPSLLDTKGLVALWREGLGAQKALLGLESGEMVGYQNHPQLDRFKAATDPVAAIVFYLVAVEAEASKRGYKFDYSKIVEREYFHTHTIPVTSGQLDYEAQWLYAKISARAPEQLFRLNNPDNLIHPLFHMVEGEIESWEKIKD